MLKFGWVLLIIALSKISFSCEDLKYENLFSFSEVIDTLDTYCYNCNNTEYKFFLNLYKIRIDCEIDSIVVNLMSDETKVKGLIYLKKYFGSDDKNDFILNFLLFAKFVRTLTAKEYANCFSGGTHYGTAFGTQYLSVSYEIIKYLTLEYSEKEFLSTLIILKNIIQK